MPSPHPRPCASLQALWRGLPGLLVLALSGGCATFRSYDAELTDTLSKAANGRVGAAIRELERNNKARNRDLLFFLELGELKRLKSDYPGSQSAWLAAERRVLEWEAAARADPERVSGAALSYVLNDKSRPYEGHDYEKVMLTTRIAMNHLAMGEWDNARVAIKRTHEREAVIGELRAQEYEKLRAEARKRGYVSGFKDLNGYPVSGIDNPEVNSLRNSYQSALSHYLAGFIYEAQGEPSLAAPGYRQAIELRPGIRLLEEGLAGLEERLASRGRGDTDTLFVIETGLAPARQSRDFNLPIPINYQWVVIPVAFPVMRSQEGFSAPGDLSIDGSPSLTPVMVTSVDAMARRSLQDEMPGILLRSAIRATGKAVAQYQTLRAAGQRYKKGDDQTAAALDFAAFALMVGAAMTESADERGWRSLPAQIHVARARLPPGRHLVTIETPAGPRSTQVNISGTHAFVGLRMLRGNLFVMRSDGSLEGGTPSPPAASAEALTVPAARQLKPEPAHADTNQTIPPAN